MSTQLPGKHTRIYPSLRPIDSKGFGIVDTGSFLWYFEWKGIRMIQQDRHAGSVHVCMGEGGGRECVRVLLFFFSRVDILTRCIFDMLIFFMSFWTCLIFQ